MVFSFTNRHIIPKSVGFTSPVFSPWLSLSSLSFLLSFLIFFLIPHRFARHHHHPAREDFSSRAMYQSFNRLTAGNDMAAKWTGETDLTPAISLCSRHRYSLVPTTYSGVVCSFLFPTLWPRPVVSGSGARGGWVENMLTGVMKPLGCVASICEQGMTGI